MFQAGKGLKATLFSPDQKHFFSLLPKKVKQLLQNNTLSQHTTSSITVSVFVASICPCIFSVTVK
jgi:hypothetical protein